MNGTQSITRAQPQAVLKSKLPPGAWLTVALLCFVGCLNYLDRVMITTMRGSIIQSIPMTEAQFGLLTAVFLWTYGILSPFAGFLADRFKRSVVIIISLFIWSTVTWLTSHASTFQELLITRALMGISEACYIPAAMALIMDYHRGSTRSFASGIHIAGVMIGQSLGFVGGWIAEDHTWNLAFSIFGLVGIAYSLVLAFFLKDVPKDKIEISENAIPEKVNFFTALKELFSSRSFNLALSFWGLLGVVGWLVVGWLPTYYQEHFNLSQATAGLYATGYFHPAALVGVLLGGYLADRWSRTNPRGRILVPFIGLCIAAPGIFIASYTSVLPLAISFFLIYALTRTFSDVNMMPILCLFTNKYYRATGYGVLNLFSCIVGGIGLYAGGMLRDAHIDLSRIFQFAALVMVVCAVLLYNIKPKYIAENN